jgi:23S rRNA (guanosine2251-2'-O)-methyltransferase
MTKKQGELIYGIHPIIELLKAKKRKLLAIYTTKPEPKSWDQVSKLLPAYVKVNYVTRITLNNMADGTDHQGVVAFTSPFVIRKKFFDSAKQPFLVMLDGIQDARNLGAILRSAYCTNADGVIMIQKGAAPLNAAALKAAAGLAEHLDIFIAPSAVAAAAELKKAGYNLYLAIFDGEKAQKVTYQEPLCIVIGGEGFGISKEILKSGIHVTLPQKRNDISYNASVAAGILLFLVATQKGKI